jgi:glycosyltransferase involved in cell wall biosynthesis
MLLPSRPDEEPMGGVATPLGQRDQIPANADVEETIRQQLADQEQEIARLRASCKPYKILSTLPYTKVDFWTEVVTTIPYRRNFLSRWTSRLGIPDLTVPIRLLRHAPRADVVLLAGGERGDVLYAALAGLLPWIRTPHIIVDAHWQKDEGVAYLLQKLLLRLGNRLIVEVQPHSEEEIAIYHAVFAVPRSKLRAIPWSTSLLGYTVEPRKGDFILTGGMSFRDYPTFFAAIQQLPFPVKVGLPANVSLKETMPGHAASPHLTIHTNWSNADYIAQTAQCRVFAMPIQPGLTRCTADQTILNAMGLGKVVVATDSIGSRAYITHGVNGFLVPESSVQDWVKTLTEVYQLSDREYERIGQQAAYDAKVRYNERLRLARILQSARDVLEQTATRRS